MNKKLNTINKKLLLYKTGICLLIVSLLLWLVPILTPFTSFPLKIKAGIITSSIVAAEVLFWGGVLLAGKEAAMKFKSYLNPKNWRKRDDIQ